MVYKHYRWALGGLKPKSNISWWPKPERNQLAWIQCCVHMKPNMIKLLCAPCVHWEWVIEGRTERWLQYVNIIHPRTAYCWPFLDQLADTFNRKTQTHTHTHRKREEAWQAAKILHNRSLLFSKQCWTVRRGKGSPHPKHKCIISVLLWKST